jgi:hypothetical protein
MVVKRWDGVLREVDIIEADQKEVFRDFQLNFKEGTRGRLDSVERRYSRKADLRAGDERR